MTRLRETDCNIEAAYTAVLDLFQVRLSINVLLLRTRVPTFDPVKEAMGVTYARGAGRKERRILDSSKDVYTLQRGIQITFVDSLYTS
jgi:hypothetical protein